MFIVVWEYHVKADHLVEFESIYKPDGEWAELFNRGAGFLGTELLCDDKHSQRYLTIDRWVSSKAYDEFRARWQNEYADLETKCDRLSKKETLLGKWESV